MTTQDTGINILGPWDYTDYPNNFYDPNPLPLSASDVQRKEYAEKARAMGLSTLVGYRDLGLTGEDLWVEFISVFRPHTIVAWDDFLLAQWVSHFEENGVYFDTVAASRNSEKLIHLLYREAHDSRETLDSYFTLTSSPDAKEPSNSDNGVQTQTSACAVQGQIDPSDQVQGHVTERQDGRDDHAQLHTTQRQLDHECEDRARKPQAHLGFEAETQIHPRIAADAAVCAALENTNLEIEAQAKAMMSRLPFEDKGLRRSALELTGREDGLQTEAMTHTDRGIGSKLFVTPSKLDQEGDALSSMAAAWDLWVTLSADRYVLSLWVDLKVLKEFLVPKLLPPSATICNTITTSTNPPNSSVQGLFPFFRNPSVVTAGYSTGQACTEQTISIVFNNGCLLQLPFAHVHQEHYHHRYTNVVYFTPNASRAMIRSLSQRLRSFASVRFDHFSPVQPTTSHNTSSKGEARFYPVSRQEPRPHIPIGVKRYKQCATLCKSYDAMILLLLLMTEQLDGRRNTIGDAIFLPTPLVPPIITDWPLAPPVQLTVRPESVQERQHSTSTDRLHSGSHIAFGKSRTSNGEDEHSSIGPDTPSTIKSLGQHATSHESGEKVHRKAAHYAVDASTHVNYSQDTAPHITIIGALHAISPKDVEGLYREIVYAIANAEIYGVTLDVGQRRLVCGERGTLDAFEALLPDDVPEMSDVVDSGATKHNDSLSQGQILSSQGQRSYGIMVQDRAYTSQGARDYIACGELLISDHSIGVFTVIALIQRGHEHEVQAPAPKTPTERNDDEITMTASTIPYPLDDRTPKSPRLDANTHTAINRSRCVNLDDNTDCALQMTAEEQHLGQPSTNTGMGELINNQDLPPPPPCENSKDGDTSDPPSRDTQMRDRSTHGRAEAESSTEKYRLRLKEEAQVVSQLVQPIHVIMTQRSSRDKRKVTGFVVRDQSCEEVCTTAPMTHGRSKSHEQPRTVPWINGYVAPIHAASDDSRREDEANSYTFLRQIEQKGETLGDWLCNMDARTHSDGQRLLGSMENVSTPEDRFGHTEFKAVMQARSGSSGALEMSEYRHSGSGTDQTVTTSTHWVDSRDVGNAEGRQRTIIGAAPMGIEEQKPSRLTLNVDRPHEELQVIHAVVDETARQRRPISNIATPNHCNGESPPRTYSVLRISGPRSGELSTIITKKQNGKGYAGVLINCGSLVPILKTKLAKSEPSSHSQSIVRTSQAHSNNEYGAQIPVAPDELCVKFEAPTCTVLDQPELESDLQEHAVLVSMSDGDGVHESELQKRANHEDQRHTPKQSHAGPAQTEFTNKGQSVSISQIPTRPTNNQPYSEGQRSDHFQTASITLAEEGNETNQVGDTVHGTHSCIKDTGQCTAVIDEVLHATQRPHCKETHILRQSDTGPEVTYAAPATTHQHASQSAHSDGGAKFSTKSANRRNHQYDTPKEGNQDETRTAPAPLASITTTIDPLPVPSAHLFKYNDMLGTTVPCIHNQCSHKVQAQGHTSKDRTNREGQAKSCTIVSQLGIKNRHTVTNEEADQPVDKQRQVGGSTVAGTEGVRLSNFVMYADIIDLLDESGVSELYNGNERLGDDVVLVYKSKEKKNNGVAAANKTKEQLNSSSAFVSKVEERPAGGPEGDCLQEQLRGGAQHADVVHNQFAASLEAHSTAERCTRCMDVQREEAPRTQLTTTQHEAHYTEGRHKVGQGALRRINSDVQSIDASQHEKFDWEFALLEPDITVDRQVEKLFDAATKNSSAKEQVVANWPRNEMKQHDGTRDEHHHSRDESNSREYLDSGAQLYRLTRSIALIESGMITAQQVDGTFNAAGASSIIVREAADDSIHAQEDKAKPRLTNAKYESFTETAIEPREEQEELVL